MALISESYRALNAKLHEDRPDYGAGMSSRRWYQPVAEFARTLGASSVLDYGCGKGELGRALSGLLVIGYDPAIPGKDTPPLPADFVVCTDVLEHIEPECLDDVLDDLLRCAKKGIFLTVATGPASKVLADGRNAHILQQPAEWWIPKLMSRWEMQHFSNTKGEFVFIATARKAVEAQRVAA